MAGWTQVQVDVDDDDDDDGIDDDVDVEMRPTARATANDATSDLLARNKVFAIKHDSDKDKS